MEKRILFLAVAFSFLFSSSSLAQNNLDADFFGVQGIPDFINICGDADTMIVQIQTDGSNNATRENIMAQANLFKGVRFVALDAALSSPGITVNALDPTQPVFSIPDLTPGGLATVSIAFTVIADCEYTDTLAQNDAAVVFDTWEMTYDLGGSSFTETDATLEYRDAFAVPFFTVDIENTYGPARVNDCFTRDVVINNSGLNGFVDTVFFQTIVGPGIRIDSFTVSGLTLNVNKMALPAGDTLVTAVLDSAFFETATTGMGPGNGDAFLNSDESVRITEHLCVLTCYAGRGSQYSISWGCYGRACNTASATDFIRIGEGAANPIFFPVGSVPNQDAGYCQSGVSAITYSNEGVEADPGFGTMLDIATGIAMGNTIGSTDSFGMEQTAFSITSVQIAGINIPNPIYLIDLDGNPLFTSDPDGPGGLTDFDGDGFFDDLPINEEIELIVTYDYDCSNAAEVGADSTCSNDVNMQLNSFMQYTDACRDTTFLPNIGYYANQNSRGYFINTTDPDAFVEEDTFFITHTFERNVRFFERNCSGTETYDLRVALPPGVLPVIDSTLLVRGGSTVPLISNSITNDTLLIQFDAASLAFLQGEYELRMAFIADCTTPLGPTVFPIDFSIYCADCDCRHRWYCGELDGPQLHANVPPCPPSVFMCPEGLRTYAFDVFRTTFGYTDNTYTTKIGQDSARNKVAISCDSVQVQVLSVVGDSPVTDSVGVVIRYDNIDDIISTDEIFIFDYATVRITNGGSEFTCTIDDTRQTILAGDTTKTLIFDLHQCLVDLGITLNPGDSIDFLGNFSIDPEGPYIVNFREVPNFRGYAYQSIDGLEVACDNFGDVFTIAKNRTVFDFPSSLSFPEGCQETSMQYRLVTTNNDFNKFFGNEFRQTLRVDSISFVYDPAILEAYDIVELEVSIQDHPIYGNSYFPIPGLDSSGTYSARFDTLTQVPSLKSGQSVPFNLRMRLTPNCRSMFASKDGDNIIEFEPTIHYIDRHYASFIGDGSCAEAITETRIGDFFYSDPPTFSFVPITNPNFFLAGDTAVWQLQHCNTSFTADAGISWMAIEDTTGAIEVVSMTDISIPTNPVDLMVTAYDTAGGHYFAFTDGLDRADGLSSLSDRCNTILIKAVVNRCGTTDFNARVGWNCTMYRESPWDPSIYPPCDDILTPLSITTLDPFLDAEIIEQPATNTDLCDTTTVGILVRNTDRGNAFDVITNLIIPMEGATIVPGSVELAYPSGSAYQPVAADPVFAGTNSRGQIYRYEGFANLSTFLNDEGLPGFDPVMPTDSNEYRIRYRIVTDCDFVSGSIIYYDVKGLRNCGDSTNLETGETVPIIINGVNPPSSGKAFDIAFDTGSGLLPGSNSTISVTAVNQGTQPTDGVSDKIRLQLPLDVVYTNGSTMGIIPPAWPVTTPETDTVGGFQYLTWCMPAGIEPGELATLTLELTAPAYDCSVRNLPVELVTLTRTTVTCTNSASDCDIDAVTSSNNGALVDLAVVQDILNFDIDRIYSECMSNGMELIYVEGDIVNNSQSDIGAVPITISYFVDANGNGEIDMGEFEIISFDQNGPIPSGGSVPFIHDFEVDQADVCSIIGMIDSTGLGLCDQTLLRLGVPQLINAGEDQLFCTDMPTTINTTIGDPDCNALGAYTYNWTAVAPATITDLSATNIPNPTVMANHPASVEDTLMYILETTRPACGASTLDTVLIIRGLQPSIEASGPYFVGAGDTVQIMTMVTGGANLSYIWSPTTNMDDSTSASPSVWPMMDTEYYVTVSSGAGCTATDTVIVSTQPVAVTTNAPDTTICAGQDFQLVASGAVNYEWIADPLNPLFGSLSSTTIATPVFSGGLGGSVYNFQVVGTDPAFPTVSDTADVRITVLASPVILTSVTDTNNCISDTVLITIQLDQPIDSYVINGGTYINDQIGGAGDVLTFQAINTGVSAVFSVQLLGNANDCPVVETFRFDECGACATATPNSLIMIEPQCGASDGIITLNLVEDESDFTFTWIPDLGTGSANSRTDLPFGRYTILITRNDDPTCTTSLDVFLQTNNGPETTALLSPATCNTADGSVSFTPTTFTYEWEDGEILSSRNDLAAGDYYVTFTDTADPACSNVIKLTIESESPLMANLQVDTAPDCDSTNGVVTILVSGGVGPYSYEWADGLMSVSEQRGGLGAGTYVVTITDTAGDGCELVYTFALSNASGLASIIPTDTVDVSCPGFADGSFEFTVDYAPGFTNPADTIITDGTFNYVNGALPAGDFCLQITDSSGCIATSTCFTIAEPNSLLLTFVVTPDCADQGSIDLTVEGGNGPYSYDWIDLNGSNDPEDRDSISMGMYGVIVMDINGCTIFENDVLVPACTDTCDYFGGLTEVEIVSDSCGGTGELCIEIPISQVGDYRIFIDGVTYTDTIRNCNVDTTTFYSYALLLGGGNTGPYDVLSWDVDSLSFSGTVNDMFDLLDSMNTWDPTGNWIIDTTSLTIIGGNSEQAYGRLLMDVVVFDAIDSLRKDQTLTINGFGFDVPDGSHEVVVESIVTDCADTLQVNVVCGDIVFTNDSVCGETIFIRESVEFCLDTTELPGTVVSIENLCPDKGGVFVDFFLDPINYCVTYEGLIIGEDSACVVLCDDLGYCDTTYFCISVVEYTDPPIAVDDSSCVEIGLPVVIDIKSNDTLYGGLTDVYILDPPLYGTIGTPGNQNKINLDCSVTYNASDEFCERWDSFTYVVCTPTGCDTAAVHIFIKCTDIVIFTAVSANGDDVNDVFYIAGIEEYPNNEVRLYNRWGTLIFQEKGYLNTWNGTWKDKDVPDGTYFYVLELNDDDKRVFRGYLELYR